MEMDDKNRFERLTETLGQHCGMVELARVTEEDAMRWVAATAQEQDVRVEADAARELVDALGADMMLISSELEKLLLYTLGKGRITLGDVETMVLSAKQRSLYELTDAISTMVAAGQKLAGLEIQGRWVDVRDPETLARLERES